MCVCVCEYNALLLTAAEYTTVCIYHILLKSSLTKGIQVSSKVLPLEKNTEISIFRNPKHGRADLIISYCTWISNFPNTIY